MERNIRLLSWFNFFTDFRLYAPFAILYFTEISGSFALGMSVFSITMLSNAIFEVPTGILSDRVGRQKTMLLGAVSTCMSIIWYATGHSYLFLCIGAVLEGIGRAFYSGNNDALLYDTVHALGKKDSFHDILGKTGSLFQVALFISSALAALFSTHSYNYLLWLSVLPQVCCIGIALLIREPTIHQKQATNIYAHIQVAWKQFLSHKQLQRITLASVISYACGEAMYQFQAAFYQSFWPNWAIALAKMSTNVLATVSFWFSGSLIDRLSAPTVLIGSALYNRCINILAALFPTSLSPLLMSSTSIFYGASNVAKSQLLHAAYTQDVRATQDSLVSLFGSMAFALIAYLIGMAGDYFSPAAAIVGVNILMIPILYIYAGLPKTAK
jgi:MFS family permease